MAPPSTFLLVARADQQDGDFIGGADLKAATAHRVKPTSEYRVTGPPGLHSKVH